MSFAERISKEEYEKQSHEYTKQMLDDLSNMVRREPSLTTKAVHFGQTYARFRSRELLLRIGTLLLVGGPLWFAFTDCDVGVPDLLNELRTRVVCKMGLDITTIPPFLLMLVGGGTFCLWILSMYLTSLQIQHKLKFTQQIVMVFISSLLLPFLTAVTVTLFIFFLVTTLYETTFKCIDGTHALTSWVFPYAHKDATTHDVDVAVGSGTDVTQDAVVTVLGGAAQLGMCVANSFGLDMKTCLFFAFVACVHAVLSFTRTIVGIGNLHNTMKFALWVISAIAVNVFNPTSTRKGEQIVFLAWASNVLVYVVELGKLLTRAVKERAAIEKETKIVEVEEEELQDVDDDEDEEENVATTTNTTTRRTTAFKQQ